MHLKIMSLVLEACVVAGFNYGPFGVNMCKLQCQQTGGCTELGYSEVHLVCILENPRTGVLLNISKIHRSLCPSSSRRVLCRGGRYICISYIPESDHKASNVTILAISRSINSYSRHAFRLDTRTGSMSFPDVISKDVSSIAYLSSIQKIALSRKFTIELLGLYSKLPEILGNNYRPYRIAVDDKENIVFFSNLQYGALIISIGAVSKRKTVVMGTKRRFGTALVAVDTTLKLLYVYLSKRLQSVPYKGGRAKSITNKRYVGISALSISKGGDFLYFSYGTKWSLFRFTVDKNGKLREQKMLSLSKKPRTMIYFKGNLFIAFYSFDEIYKVDLEQNTMKSLKETGENILDICLLT